MGQTKGSELLALSYDVYKNENINQGRTQYYLKGLQHFYANDTVVFMNA